MEVFPLIFGVAVIIVSWFFAFSFFRRDADKKRQDQNRTEELRRQRRRQENWRARDPGI